MRTALSLLFIVLVARFVRPPVCNDYGGWGPYDDGESFGSKDWFCDLPRGHAGDHWGRA